MGQTRDLTAYQLSNEIKEDYRAVSKVISNLEEMGIIEITGFSSNSHKAKIYSLSDSVINRIKSDLQAKKSKVASAVSSTLTADLKQLKDLQTQVLESEKTIKSLNDLINNKDKEIQTLINENTMAKADNKVLQSEIKLITDKKASFENSFFEEKRRNETLTAELKRKTLYLIITSASLLVVATISGMLLIQ